jgi:hypothetical protein
MVWPWMTGSNAGVNGGGCQGVMMDSGVAVGGQGVTVGGAGNTVAGDQSVTMGDGVVVGASVSGMARTGALEASTLVAVTTKITVCGV